MTKIDIFSGFLGAGKTTLIKKLIKESFAGQKVVLIENEFGEIGIDGGFLKESGIQINELNAGCICCSLVGDFRAALQQVVEQYHPDRIVIEPSGVGKLSDVTRAVEGVAEHLDVQLSSFVTVADVNKVKMYMKNFGEFYDDQISHASCIILSRTQNATEEKIAAAVAMLREKNPTATIVTTAWDALTGEQILKAMSTKDDFKAELIAMAAKANEEHAHEDEEEEHEHHHHHDHDNDHDEHCCCGHHHDDDDDDEDEHEHHHHHDHDDDRAAPLGTGTYKVGGNYAASLRANKKAHDLGYACEFYLDAKEKKYMDECGAANFFGIKDNTYITPKSTSILPSITNKSLMQLAEDMGMKVERRPVPEEELLTFEEAGACGTAAVISPIERIDDVENGKSYVISKDGKPGPVCTKLYNKLRAIQYGDEPDTHGWVTIVE